VYVFVFDVPQPASVVVGALGRAQLAPGRYGYVGSARRGLAARLARHARKRKPRRWHIDYLARLAVPVGALTWPWREGRECRLAEALTATGAGRLCVPRFGASDCRCPGHLFALAEPDLGSLAARLSPPVGAAGTVVGRGR
jgi:sugar fermentation stimulation protein A